MGYKYSVILNLFIYLFNDFLDSAEILCVHTETVPSKNL